MDKNIGIKITGSSDDIIQILGEIYEEFDAFDCQDGNISLSDGTLLSVQYDDDGIWRFKVVYKGSLFDKKIEGNVDEDVNDEVYFKSGIKWVMFAYDDCEIAKR